MQNRVSEVLLFFQVLGEKLHLDWWGVLILATFFSVGLCISLHAWYAVGISICVPVILYLLSLPDGREEA